MNQRTDSNNGHLDVQVVLADQQEQLDNIILALQAQQQAIDALVRDVAALFAPVRGRT